jgi:hypothetical protein
MVIAAAMQLISNNITQTLSLDGVDKLEIEAAG